MARMSLLLAWTLRSWADYLLERVNSLLVGLDKMPHGLAGASGELFLLPANITMRCFLTLRQGRAARMLSVA